MEQPRVPLLRYRYEHAKLRAMERFGVDLSDYDYCCLIQDIMDGKAEHVRPLERDRVLYRVKFENTKMYAVYSTVTLTIVTFLTTGMVR